MKLVGIFIVCFAFLMLGGIGSSEAEENVQQLDNVYQDFVDGNYDAKEVLLLNRHKRGTCSFHESFCVAHCRVRGYKRGYCSSKGICTCRG